jgi:hypothetical protein
VQAPTFVVLYIFKKIFLKKRFCLLKKVQIVAQGRKKIINAELEFDGAA